MLLDLVNQKAWYYLSDVALFVGCLWVSYLSLYWAVIYVEDTDWEDSSPGSRMPRQPSGDSLSSTPRKAPLNGKTSV